MRLLSLTPTVVLLSALASAVTSGTVSRSPVANGPPNPSSSDLSSSNEASNDQTSSKPSSNDPSSLSSNALVGAIRVARVTYGGSGCPQGSMAYDTDPDSGALSLRFSKFQATTDSQSTRRQFCQVNFNIAPPTGYEYSVITTTTTGYVSTRDSLNATISKLYYYSGGSGYANRWHSYWGHQERTFEVYDKVEELGWSGCDDAAGRSLNVKTQVILTGDADDDNFVGTMSVDDQQVDISQTLKLALRKCATAEGTTAGDHRAAS